MKRLTISIIISMSFATMIFFMISLGAIAIWRLNYIGEISSVLHDIHVPGNRAVNQVERHTTKALLSFERYIYTSNEENFNNQNLEINNALQIIKKIKELAEQVKFQAMIDMQNVNIGLISKYLDEIKTIHSIIQANKDDSVKAKDLIKGNVENANSVIKELLNNLEKMNSAGWDMIVDVARQNKDGAIETKKMLIICIIILSMITVVFSYSIRTHLTKLLIIMATNIADSAEKLNNTSKNAAVTSQELAESTNQQANALQETTASLEELTQMVNQNVNNAEKSNQVNQRVKEASVECNSAMDKLIFSMKDIKKSNDNIQELVRVIGEIANKTAVIDEIVFQTKLLSFNASVEAERAGEHGRGFAVVAQEVGNLAQMSGKAALEIATIVRESISKSEQITKDNRQKVETGNSLVEHSAALMKKVEEYAKEVSELSHQIVTASREQSVGLGQINGAIGQLDQAVQGNANLSRQTADASEEIKSQALMLQSFVSNLRKIVVMS